MSFYKVKYSKSAEKFIKKNKAIGIRFFKAFIELAEDKENIQFYDVKKFHSKNYDDIFRLRIGDYRAVFRIVENELLVYVFDIGSRGDIYKKRNVWYKRLGYCKRGISFEFYYGKYVTCYICKQESVKKVKFPYKFSFCEKWRMPFV